MLKPIQAAALRSLAEVRELGWIRAVRAGILLHIQMSWKGRGLGPVIL